MTDNIIATDANTLVSNSSAFINLYELDMGGVVYYFHPENSDQDIVFDNKTYIPYPIMLEGVEMKGDGAAPRPSLTMANVDSLLDANTKTELGIPQDFQLDDLVGSRVTRRQTLEKYTGVGVTAYEFPTDVFVIDRIASRNDLVVQLELASPFDFGGKRVPSRVVTGKYCPWVYKGYSGSFDNASSACRWRDQNQLKVPGTGTYSFFFSIDDEPIVKETLTEITSAPSWLSTTSYSVEDVVLYSGSYWASKSNNNVGNTPTDNAVNWKLIRTFSVWSTDGTGSKSYTTNDLDPRKNSYVYHANTVWRAIRPHTKSLSIEPGSNALYWVPGDVCGKLLSSCKARYQAKEISGTGTGNNARPQVGAFNTSVPLPFGGFPASRKFR